MSLNTTDLITTLESLAKSDDLISQISDDATRVRLMAAAGAVKSRLEMPFDTYFRLIFTDMTLGLAQSGDVLGFWSTVAAAGSDGITSTDLAQKTGVLQPTVERVMRYAIGENMVDEVGENKYRSNNLTRYFTAARGSSVITLANSECCRIGSAMPKYFANNKQVDMQEARPRAWNMAVGTEKEVWEWLAEPQHKVESDAFNDFMWAQADNLASFTDVFRLDQKVQLKAEHNPQRMQFVDVGGGSGHISRAVLGKYPELHGRIAVEDRGDLRTVTRTDFEAAGIRCVPHNFFMPQPLRGAKVYYMRNILHDWNDEKCREILSHLREAMVDDTVILVDDVVTPGVGANWYAGASDMMMLTNLGAIERTEKQFDELFASVGLKRAELTRYNSYGPAIQTVIKA